MSDPSLPTQARHPWRATFRTVVAAAFALGVILPAIADQLGVSQLRWVALALGVAGAVTRVLAMPQVNAWITEYLPWLSATPRSYEGS